MANGLWLMEDAGSLDGYSLSVSFFLFIINYLLHMFLFQEMARVGGLFISRLTFAVCFCKFTSSQVEKLRCWEV